MNKIIVILLLLISNEAFAQQVEQNKIKTYTFSGTLEEFKFIASAIGSSKKYSWEEINPLLNKLSEQINQQLSKSEEQK